MIGLVKGVLLEKLPPDVLVDVQGVGYEIQLPMTSFYSLPNVGEDVTLFTHFIVREDAQLLYGFTDKLERALFRELIKANGVGPKLACTILSGMSANHFIQCVSLEDISTLVKLPGVGKKTAERLVVELKDRLAKMSSSTGFSQITPITPEQSVTGLLAPAMNVKSEAISALLALGYKSAQAEKVVKSVYKDDMKSEDVIRDALRSLV